MFGILDSITRAAIGVATLPVSVAADVLTCGGITTDKKQPYTIATIAKIGRNIDDATEAPKK